MEWHEIHDEAERLERDIGPGSRKIDALRYPKVDLMEIPFHRHQASSPRKLFALNKCERKSAIISRIEDQAEDFLRTSIHRLTPEMKLKS